LLKKIQELKKEKEALALNYEQEEEFLTNDLSRKLFQVSLVFSLHWCAGSVAQ
jgi:coiled-coil domain-containing protein 6